MAKSKMRQIYENLSAADYKVLTCSGEPAEDYACFVKGCERAISLGDRFEIHSPLVQVLPKKPVFNFNDYRDFYCDIGRVIDLHPDNWLDHNDKPGIEKGHLILGHYKYNEEYGIRNTVETKTPTKFEYSMQLHDEQEKSDESMNGAVNRNEPGLVNKIETRLIREIEVFALPFLADSHYQIKITDIERLNPKNKGMNWFSFMFSRERFYDKGFNP